MAQATPAHERQRSPAKQAEPPAPPEIPVCCRSLSADPDPAAVCCLPASQPPIPTMADRQRVVVLAADASEHSDYAFNYYVENIHQPNNYVYVVTCLEFYMPTSDYEVSADHIDSRLQESSAKADVLRAKYLDMLAESGVAGEFVVLQDSKTGHGVVEFAKSKEAALIVTGSRGLGMVRSTIMGSVSDYIIHHSDVPVLVCRHKKHRENK